MNQASFRPRNGYGGFSREQAARHKSSNGGGGGPRTVGLYDSYYPKMQRHWISLCPTQVWASEFYDRQAKEVVQLQAEYLAYMMHRTKTVRFICSSTAHKNKPCYGCSERERFFRRRNELKEELGYVPPEFENAPLMAMQQFAISLTILEEMGEYPKLDAQGEPVKSKRGQVIHDWVTTHSMRTVRLGGKPIQPRAKSFGHRFHWSFGPDHLGALIAENEMLSSYCAHCAGPLTATFGQCRSQTHDGESFDPEGNPILEDCGTILVDEPVPHDRLHEVMQEMYDCPTCGETDKLDFGWSCENCGIETKPGSIFDFELQIGATGEGDHTPKVYNFRPRQDYSHIEGYQELIFTPLDLKAICAPEKLEWQLNKLPRDRQKTATPDAHIEESDGSEGEDLGSGEDSAPIEY